MASPLPFDGVMNMSDPEQKAEDALRVAQRALEKVNRLEQERDDLRDRVDELEEAVVALQFRVSEYDQDRSYDELTRDDKVGILREESFRRACDRPSGGVALDYNDIRDLFRERYDGRPSPAHCYDLMKDAAAGYDGFDHVKNPQHGNERLTVDADEARVNAELFALGEDRSRFFREKTEPAGVPRE